ncbi:23S rRNA (Uracil-5-)-methyltransferase RumB [Actinomyces sp. Chiba101]|uniref:methyltransferase domain-containing protein n=1 Tax=Actinomyces TaxID=1654 RepID=UPI000974E9FD|nr:MULTISPECIES: methyltransferase domain-containing protein [Actinomyces]BAW94059.1 23S rRNA (Uracil-5-)-methyltransferase RumB [Actinomyces sp. Chiba101]GAV95384.1 23S rRNA (Uracil-5-)-methyltransferase RumB [Actinomyces denticolens]SUU14149.1 23S rRNA (uracil(747)-C(5))-methyltransferase RlmC [Actinomyces denticolens]
MDTALEAQLAAKQDAVARRLGAHVPDAAWEPPAMSEPSHFRNKAKMAVSGTADAPILGLADRWGGAVDLRSCPLHAPVIEEALPVLAGFIGWAGLEPYSIPERRGELKHLLVTASPDGDLMVRFVLRSRRLVGRLREGLTRLRGLLPTLAVASANIQPIHQAILEGDEEIVLTEEDSLLMRLSLPGGARTASGRQAASAPRELALHLPTRAFFQTNTAVTEALYATARDWAVDVPVGAGPVRRAWDLFCGVGGFALALAGGARGDDAPGPGATGLSVLGMELSASAIDGARASAALAGLPPGRVRFEAGDARVLDPSEARELGGLPDLLIVNPPRRGIGEELAEGIEASGVGRVLYSSCNPMTLADDLARMPSLRVRRARLFDMFPHTTHAEVLVELTR